MANKQIISIDSAFKKIDAIVKSKKLSQSQAIQKVHNEFRIKYENQFGKGFYILSALKRKYITYRREAGIPSQKPVAAPKELSVRERIVNLLKKGEYKSISAVSDHFDVGVGKVRAIVEELRSEGFNIKIKDDSVMISKIIEKKPAHILDVSKMSTAKIRFGAIGDNHLCSNYERLDVLNALYDEFARQKITTVYNTGNWIDGEARFNKHDLHTHGMDKQIAYFLENYPQRKGITTYLITGDDHEGWYSQREGIDVGQIMQMKAELMGRKDLVYIGHMEADVIIKAKKGQTMIRVLHPGGGSAYALSYTVQKIVESYTGNEKPDVLLVGHYHKAEYSYVRGVHCVQTGCFTGSTKIETSNGRKNIKDIKMGDLVLTHKNRYRKVVSIMTPRYADDFWTLNYGRKGRLDQSITATSEHPFLVERDGIREWMEIKDVKKGDFVFVLPSECAVTKEKIPYWMKMSKNANPMHIKETRDKLSESRGGFKNFRKNSGSGDLHLKRDILPFCEKMASEGWKIVPVGNKVTPDAIGFKDGKVVAFELEGKQGNSLEYKKTKYDGADIMGYVDEVTWVNVKNKKDQPRSEYEYDEATGCVKVRVISCKFTGVKRKHRKRETVYNFGVEEDNSYVANKVVVHNCTEDQTPFMRKKRLAAHLGGWIIDMTTDDVGAVTSFGQQFFPFYDNAYYEKWKYLWNKK